MKARHKVIAAATLAVLSMASHAEALNLVCVSTDGKDWSMNFGVDTVAKALCMKD